MADASFSRNLHVSAPCRMAQAAVVCNGVQASLQAPQRLVPTHQGRKQRHGVHRGELPDGPGSEPAAPCLDQNRLSSVRRTETCTALSIVV